MSVSEDKLKCLLEDGIGSKKDLARLRHGNIIEDFKRGLHPILAVGISCFNTYDRGLIANIMKAFPGTQECLNSTKDADFKKLGTNLYVDLGDGRIIVFMFIQKSDYFRTSVKTSSKINLDSLDKCVRELVETIGPKRSIAMPQLGIFRNKNHWLNVKQTIENVLDENEDTKLTIYKVSHVK